MWGCSCSKNTSEQGGRGGGGRVEEEDRGGAEGDGEGEGAHRESPGSIEHNDHAKWIVVVDSRIDWDIDSE